MSRPSRLRVSSQWLAASLVLLSSHSALAQRAGVVEFAIGEVSAHAANGSVRSLVKNADVQSGDRIITRSGRAQIRFVDGAFVSLVPETEFHVRDYRFDGRADGNETGFFSIARGTIRAISGLIGKANRSRFEIQTPTATLGIRGTAGIISVAADGTTKVTATQGVWELKNGAGTMHVPAGVTGVVTPNLSAPPRRTQEAASASPAPQSTGRSGRGQGQQEAKQHGAQDQAKSQQEQAPEANAQESTQPHTSGAHAGSANDSTLASGPVSAAAGDHVNSTGKASSVSSTTTSTTTAPPPPSSFTAAATALQIQGGTPYQHSKGVDSASIVTAGTPPTPYRITDLAGPTTFALGGPGTTVLDPGSDGASISWSRWIGTFDALINGTYQSVTLGANQGFHMIAINPTPQASIPTTGVVNFTFLGGTNPTFSNGTMTAGVFTAGVLPMQIDFAIGKIALDFKVDFTGAQTGGSPLTANVSTGAAAFSPVAFALDGGGNRKPFFDGVLNSANVTVTGGGPNGSLNCMPNCSAVVMGGLAGPAADRVGITYRIYDPAGAGITGAAAYKK